MYQHTSSTNRRNLRTFVASLLSYALLTSQLAPVAMALNGSAVRNAPPAGTSDIERKKTSEPPPQERGDGSFAPVPVPLRVTAAGMAPIISATKTDSFPDPDMDGKVSPGQIITYNVTLTNTGPDPALNLTLNDTVDPNTTIVLGSAVATPIAFADAYNVIGNVRIQPNAAQGLLANDINPNTGNNTGLTASGGTTSTQGGNVSINADGSFSYDPPVGFTGTDTFTYTATSTNGVDTRTVTLTVAGMIFFVNDDDPVAGGDGRLTNPFNCLVGAGCFSVSTADEAGDNIFLFNGAYTGGLTFLANQKLIGQGTTDTLANIAGVGAVQPYSDPLPVTNGTPSNVTITTAIAATNALTVNAGGNTLRGFTVGNTTGAKIFGSGFGALTAGNSVSPDLILNGSGKALDLTNGSFVATSGFNSISTTSSSSQGISLSTVTGTASFGSTTVSGSTTQGILVGTTTANINFGNTSVTGGTDGISFQNNSSGTRTFGTLGVSGGSANAFLHGAGGGNVTVGGAATLSSAGDAISVSAPTNTNVINFQAATSATRTAAGGNGVNWTGTAGATMTFSALTIQTNAGTGLNTTVGGTINVTNATGTINNTTQAAPAIVANAVALNANFSAINSSGGTNAVSLTTVTGTSNFGGGSLSGASGATFLVSGGTASTTFSGNITQGNNAAMVFIGGGHTTGTLTFNTGTLSATNGTGLQFDNADGTYNFNGTNTLNGGDAGIDVANGSGGTFTFASGTTITNPTGIAYREDTSTATVNYNGTITKTNNAANAVDINAKTGGATTFSGAISATTTTANAIDLTNTGGTVTFRGGMVVSTTSGIGFNATGSGTTVNVCDENPCVPAATGALVNTLTSTTGSALNVANTTIGANKLEFRSISSNGATNGIILNTTGASGGLTVSGNGGTCTSVATCTGGTIQNAAVGVSLTSTTSPSFDRMFISNTTDSGINGTTVTNFSFTNGKIDNSGNAAFESNIAFNTNPTTASNIAGTLTLTGNTLTNAFYSALDVQAGNGTVTNANISNNVMTSSTSVATSVGFGVNINGVGTATTAFALNNATITGNSITNFPSASGIQINGGNANAAGPRGTIGIPNDAGNLVSITNNTIQGQSIANRMGGSAIIVAVIGGNNSSATTRSRANINISSNPTLTNIAGTVIGVGCNGHTTMTATVNNNVIVANQQPNFGGANGIGGGDGIGGAGTAWTPALTMTVTGNNISQTDGNGILLVNRATNGSMDLKITGNTVGAPINAGGTARQGIRVDSGNNTAGEDTNVCVTISGNTSAGSNGAAGIGIRKQGTVATTNDFGITGLAPSPATGPQAAAFVATQNPAGGGCDNISGSNFVSCATAPAAPETFDGDEITGPGGDSHSPGAPGDIGTPGAPASQTESITSRPFISSPQLRFLAAADEIIQGNRIAGDVPNVGFRSKRDGGSAFNYAVSGTSAPLGQAQTRGSQDKQSKGGGGKPDAPSTTSSTHQETGGPTTKPTVQTAVPGVVVDPGLRYIPKPRPVAPPVGDGLPTQPVIVGDNLTWNVGTLPAGQSVTITFQVTVDNPFMGALPQVSNQGTVTADGINVLTDDPAVGGSNDPTVTGVTVPSDLFVRDARVAEPTLGSTSMLFTLALSTPAPAGGIVVNLSTANGTATGGTCVAGDDYETVSGGTATFAAGEQIKMFPVTVCADATAEGDETFSLNVNSAPGAVIVDGQGLGTITANVPGTILISELRTSGPGGAGDDFVEIYNNTDTPHTVPAGGYGLFKMGADCNALPVLIGTIPAATVIPQRGHYLFVGSTYSLTVYAGGNAVLTTDIESDFNVGLFTTVDPLQVSTANRLDAVGFGISTGGVCALLLEGTTLPPAEGSTSQYSFVREFKLLSNDVPTATDDNDNAADFTLVSTTPLTAVGQNAPRLGAPGPENLAGPNLKKYSQVGAQFIDPMLSASVAPNRARDTTPDPANNSTLGTLANRRTFTNNTGAPITRLRFRIYDITTFPSPVGTADLRARTSTNAVVTVTGVGSVTALATTLETPPAQPNSGGLNSSLAAGTVTLGTPLASGASIHLNFLFGVQQSGSFRVFVFVEAVP